MKHIFIVNPVSGKGKALSVSLRIKKVCEEEKLDYEVHYTNGPLDATRLVKSIKGKNIIYSVGGDGTLNEVLNGIIGTKNILSVVPAGSGNDFYKTLERIDDEMPLIDVGKVNKKYFINVVSIGIDAEVAKNAEVMKKFKIPSSQIYNASIIYTFFKYKFKDIEFTVDSNSFKGKCTLLTVCNGKTYGGGYKIAPEALLSDGYFDVYFVNKIHKPIMPFLISKLKNGTHESLKEVNKSKATKIKFKCDHDLVCNIDGEIMLDKKFNIKLIPKALLIYNNKKLINKFMKEVK